MSAKHTYTLTFRGEYVEQFTTVNPEVHVVLGYRRTDRGISRRPTVIYSVKTAKVALSRAQDENDRLYIPNGLPNANPVYYGVFVVQAKPGHVEITDAPVVS